MARRRARIEGHLPPFSEFRRQRCDTSPGMTALAPEFPDSLFAHKPFALFWSARVMSTIAFQLQGVAVGWQIYALTHSAFALGMVGLVQFLPMLGLTLVVGHVADRYDRRRIIALC